MGFTVPDDPAVRATWVLVIGAVLGLALLRHGFKGYLPG